MNVADVHLTDNSDIVLSELEDKKDIILLEIGLQAEKYAMLAAPVDTSRLKNSITHLVKDDAVYIGTDVPYAPYQELGTGIYATDGQGKKTAWSYTDNNGNEHITRGIKPKHFLKNAAANHTDTYKQIIKKTLQK